MMLHTVQLVLHGGEHDRHSTAACHPLTGRSYIPWHAQQQSFMGLLTLELAPLLLHADVQGLVAGPGPQLARVLKLRGGAWQ